MVFFAIPYFVSLLLFLFQYLPVKEFKLLDDRTAQYVVLKTFEKGLLCQILTLSYSVNHII